MTPKRLLLTSIGLLVALSLLVLGLNQLDRDKIASAYDAAESERFEEALAALEHDSPLDRSTASLYDEGVVWYRRGDVPQAIAAWRAAHELSPRNADLIHNLAVARGELEGAATPAPPAGVWMEVITPGELGVIACLLWMLAAGAGWRARRGTHESAASVASVYLAAFLLSTLALYGRSLQQHNPTAVTIEEAIARDGADLEAGHRFVFAPGSELRAHARRGPFVLVEDGDQRRGWVLIDSLSIPRQGSL